MGLGVDCRECSAEVAHSVFDHDPECETARSIARRQLEQTREQRGSAWETNRTEEYIEKYEEFLEEGNHE